MEEIKDINWFKRCITPYLSNYEIEYRYYDEGDFGALSQVNFDSQILKKGGNVDFWGLGWLGIMVWDYSTESYLLNVLLEPHQNEEKEKFLEKLKELLK